MSFSELFDHCKSIYSNEHEMQIAYLFGQKPQTYDVQNISKKSYQIITFAFASFARLLISRATYFGRPNYSETTYLFFIGSVNQYKALESLASYIKKKHVAATYISIAKLGKIDTGVPWTQLKFTLKDIFLAMILLGVRIFPLIRRLKEPHLRVGKLNPLRYLSEFISTYAWISYFLRVLLAIKPKYVVISNDHNPSNRSLIAVAHYLRIQTVYMQHATVSNLFPALRFDYAFLDGESALKTYTECESNSPGKQVGYPIPRIFLTGQMKQISSSCQGDGKAIGIALDSDEKSITQIIKSVHLIMSLDVQVCIRWHPLQGAFEIDTLRSEFKFDSRVTLSDSRIESVNVFFNRCKILIAGNSSIHLEAAVFGLKTVYYEFSKSPHPDYYGFVKLGISRQIRDIEILLQYIRKQVHTAATLQTLSDVGRQRAIKYFSESYDTKWQGHEGEIVGETLERLRSDRDVTDLYERSFSNTVFSGISGFSR